MTTKLGFSTVILGRKKSRHKITTGSVYMRWREASKPLFSGGGWSLVGVISFTSVLLQFCKVYVGVISFTSVLVGHFPRCFMVTTTYPYRYLEFLPPNVQFTHSLARNRAYVHLVPG